MEPSWKIRTTTISSLGGANLFMMRATGLVGFIRIWHSWKDADYYVSYGILKGAIFVEKFDLIKKAYRRNLQNLTPANAWKSLLISAIRRYLEYSKRWSTPLAIRLAAQKVAQFVGKNFTSRFVLTGAQWLYQISKATLPTCSPWTICGKPLVSWAVKLPVLTIHSQ